jgi:GTP-binding protein
MFYDQARITVRGGRGGNGVVSFRREAMTPRGGPDGGNGGRGGSVILVANRHLNSLYSFQYKRIYEAPDGRPGRGKNQTGRSGKEMYIEVPPGTVVRDSETGAVLGDLTEPDQQLIVARGGRGGRGNTVFATSSNQAPQMAENGSPGEEHELMMELKLIADIGIVGLPNAGKSTLLTALTAAHPKIGDYPFTTLEPNLGVAAVDGARTVVLADIPGLIEGASHGAGLGHEFLRHVERTRVLIHILDGMSSDPYEDYQTIQAELSTFGYGLNTKPQVMAMNKMDLPDAQAAYELFCHAEGTPEALKNCMPISAATREGVRALLMRAVQLLDQLPPVALTEIEPVLQDIGDLHDFQIRREGGGFRIVSPMLVKRVETTRWDLDEAVQRFQNLLQRTGISAELEQRGIKKGDTVYIGDYELEWSE